MSSGFAMSAPGTRGELVVEESRRTLILFKERHRWGAPDQLMSRR